MAEKLRNTHKQNKKCLNFFLTYTNDLRISWRITKQNFTSFPNFPKMAKYGRKLRNIHKQYKKCLKFFLTCPNNLRISWRITEQNFSSFHNRPKIAKYYVNSQNGRKKSRNTHKHYRKHLKKFRLAPMTIKYREE